ncbi:glycosyltransferase family 2 protein [Butyrivibrio sp. VCD2006]|uniref:glycosyltransferase family 2 protein n=1 Tax=Butyrivibrio sp. VCD2006 TaxID=1280664 RepID=UPI0003FA470F|nr:glycosyltransferase family 2 protein [Butyrivibrio sp. VCD2006]
MTDITVIILTKDEEENIERCINSVKEWVSRIVVIDSYSNDKTVEIAKNLGAEVIQHEFIHYGAQFQFALDNADIRTKWVFRLDADEEVSEETEKEIEDLCLIHDETDVNGFVFRLQNVFMGRKLKHGFVHILEKLCIFKYGKAAMEDRYFGEQIILTEGSSISLRSLSLHYPVRNLNFFVNKLNWYASREAKDFLSRLDGKQDFSTLDRPTMIRRIIKYKVYYKLSPRIRSSMMFFYYYILKLGFLDGIEGFYWHFLQIQFLRTLVDAKMLEVKKSGKSIGETGSWN